MQRRLQMEEFGKNARRLAEREFDRNKLGAQFVEFLEKVNSSK